MKRILRSAASNGDAKNRSQVKSPLVTSRSKLMHKNATLKENKENATTIGKKTKKNNFRKDAVQPLQEKNSVALEPKNDKSALSSTSARTAQPKKPAPNVDTVVPTDAVSKTRNRRKLADDKKRAEEKIVTEPDKTATMDQPSSTLAPEKSIEVPSVTIRKRKSPKTVQPSSKLAPENSVEVPSVTMRKRKPSQAVQKLHTTDEDAKRQDNEKRSSAQEMPAIDNPTKKTRQNNDKKKVVKKNTTIKPVVPFSTETRTTAKLSGESNVSSPRGTRSRITKSNTQAIKTPTKKPSAVTTKSEGKNSVAKTPHASNVKVGQKQEKKSTKPASQPKTTAESKSTTQPENDSAKFVTVRRNRKKQVQPTEAAVVNDDKPQKATISNVTTRRRRANNQTGSKDISKDIDTVSDITKRKRSQSVHSATNEKNMDTKSKVDAVVSPPKRKRSQTVDRATNEKKMVAKSKVDAIVSPPKRRRIAKKEDPKIVVTAAKQQQPELLGNRSNASDSSDRSNASAVPIYKRISSTNNNTVNSVFDFESNSQENTLNNDEETQQVIAKLVRNKRASIAKPKRNRTKGGVTKSKSNVTRSKKVEKLRSDLMQLKELKLHSTIEPAPNVTKRRVIPIPQMTLSRLENITKNTRNPVRVVDLEDEENVIVENLSKKSQRNDQVLADKHQSTPVDDVMDDFVDDMVDDMQFDVGNSDVEDNTSIPKPSNPPELKTTPTRQAPATYTGPRKEITALHQSTPVQIVNAGNASPWRLNSDGVKYPANVFARYSECEKSPIKSGDVTKVAPEVKSPAKKPRPPVAKKPVTQHLPEAVDKPKTLDSDIRNGFGFFDDDDDGDECIPQRPSLPALNLSPVAPHKKASPKKPATAAISPKKSTKDSKATATTSSKFFKMPQVFNRLREKVQSLKNTQVSVSSTMSKPQSQSKISTHFGDASKPSSSSRRPKATENTSKCEGSRFLETEATASYADNDALSLFETTWLTDDKPHRSYSRVTKREPKRQYEYKSHLATDDETIHGESVVQKRTKRTKPKDDKYQEELRQFEENMNSDFMDVENFEMIMERSVSSSSVM